MAIGTRRAQKPPPAERSAQEEASDLSAEIKKRAAASRRPSRCKMRRGHLQHSGLHRRRPATLVEKTSRGQRLRGGLANTNCARAAARAAAPGTARLGCSSTANETEANVHQGTGGQSQWQKLGATSSAPQAQGAAAGRKLVPRSRAAFGAPIPALTAATLGAFVAGFGRWLRLSLWLCGERPLGPRGWRGRAGPGWLRLRGRSLGGDAPPRGNEVGDAEKEKLTVQDCRKCDLSDADVHTLHVRGYPTPPAQAEA